MYIVKKKGFSAMKRKKSAHIIRLKQYAPRKGDISQIYYALKNPSAPEKGPTVIKRQKFEKWQLWQKGTKWRHLSN
jgi:hypothetical protein